MPYHHPAGADVTDGVCPPLKRRACQRELLVPEPAGRAVDDRPGRRRARCSSNCTGDQGSGGLTDQSTGDLYAADACGRRGGRTLAEHSWPEARCSAWATAGSPSICRHAFRAAVQLDARAPPGTGGAPFPATMPARGGRPARGRRCSPRLSQTISPTTRLVLPNVISSTGRGVRSAAGAAVPPTPWAAPRISEPVEGRGELHSAASRPKDSSGLGDVCAGDGTEQGRLRRGMGPESGGQWHGRVTGWPHWPPPGALPSDGLTGSRPAASTWPAFRGLRSAAARRRSSR